MNASPARPDGTKAAFIGRYHTLLRREAWQDPRGRAWILRSLERSLGATLPAERDAPILDVGCGEGALLELLRRRGYHDLSAFDLSPENVELCRRAGFDFVRMHDALDIVSYAPERSYRVVYLVDLIEHLRKEDVVPFLRAVRSRVAPGGIVVARMPNMGSLLGALERYGDLTHEWGPTERSAADVFVAAGFAAPDVAVAASWEAATGLGRVRETYLRLLHRVVYLSAGRARPRIASANLVVRAVVR